MGYWGHFDRLARQFSWVNNYQNDLCRFNQKIHKHTAALILVSKLTLSFSIPVLLAAGMARVSWKRWFPFLLAAECLWSGALVIFGVYYGRYISHLKQGMQVMGVVGLVGLVGLLLWLSYRTTKR